MASHYYQSKPLEEASRHRKSKPDEVARREISFLLLLVIYHLLTFALGRLLFDFFPSLPQ